MTTLGDYAPMLSPHNKIRYVDDINVYKLSEIWSGMFILDPPVACLPVACLPVCRYAGTFLGFYVVRFV